MTDFNIRRTKVFDIEYIKGGKKEVESFTVTELNAESGLKYGKMVQKIVAPLYAEFIAQATQHARTKEDDSAEGIPPEIYSALMAKASEAIAELDHKEAINLVCESVSLPPAQFNNKFNGKLIAFVKLLKEIVMFNFEDVFIELGLGEMLFPTEQVDQ